MRKLVSASTLERFRQFEVNDLKLVGGIGSTKSSGGNAKTRNRESQGTIEEPPLA